MAYIRLIVCESAFARGNGWAKVWDGSDSRSGQLIGWDVGSQIRCWPAGMIVDS